MSELRKIDGEQIKEAIAARYHVAPASDVCLYHDYEFVRRGNDKVRREFFYGIIDERCKQPLTNADRIRSLTDEELAEFVAHNADCYWCKVKKDGCSASGGDCQSAWLDWLKQEVEDG